MTCRVGITTDLEKRKAYWESQHRTLRNWKILSGPHRTKAAAQAREDEEAERLGCVAHPGGPDVPGAMWYVYYFRYGG